MNRHFMTPNSDGMKNDLLTYHPCNSLVILIAELLASLSLMGSYGGILLAM